MNKDLFLVLVVIGLSGVMVVGSALITIQPIFASSDQETAGEDDDEPQDQSGGGDGSEMSEEEPTDEPEAELEPEPKDGDAPTLQQEQGQLALDIITANGLTPLNTTTGSGTIEKCAVSSDGQHTFCYEPLPTEDNCLKPIKAEDPPLCSSK